MHTFIIPSEAQVYQQMMELQARFGLTDDGLCNVLDWLARNTELSTEGEEKLMTHYLVNGMPYEAAKAITIDPYTWIRATLKEELNLVWNA